MFHLAKRHVNHKITSIFDRCHSSYAAATSAKYERYIPQVTSIFITLKNRKTNGTVEIVVTPPLVNNILASVLASVGARSVAGIILTYSQI